MIGRLRNALGGVSSPVSPPLESASRDLFSPVFKRSHGLWRSRQAELTVAGRLSLYKSPSEVKVYDVNSPKKLIIGAGKTSLHVKIVTQEGQKLYLKVKGGERDQWASRMMEFKFPKDDNDGDTTVDTIDSEMERSLLSGRQTHVGSTPFPKRKNIGSPVINYAASETSCDAEEEEKFVMLGEGLPLTKSQEVIDMIHNEEKEIVLDQYIVEELPLEDEEAEDKKKFDLSPSIQMRMGMTADGRTFFPRENDPSFCAIDANAGHTPFPKRRSIVPQVELSDSETEVEMTTIPVDPLKNTFRPEDEKYYTSLSPQMRGVQSDLDDSDYDDETEVEMLDEEICEEKTEEEWNGGQQESLLVKEEPKELEVKKITEEPVMPVQKAKTWGPGHVARMAQIFDRTIRAGTRVIDPEELAKAGL